MRFLVVLVALLFAGCVVQMPSPDDFDTSGPGGNKDARVVDFTVLTAEVKPGRCFDGAEVFGDSCHVFTVEVDNTGYQNDVETGHFVWKGVDADGGQHDRGDGSADQVPGGSVGTLDVSFTFDDGPLRLVELKYDGFQGNGRAPVPEY